MDFAILIPISLFACIAYSIKVIADAYTRRRIIASQGSEELLRSLLLGEATRRRHASLHWGCVLTMVAIAFGLVEAMGVDQVTPGVVGLLVGATGLGNLVFYFLEGRVGRPLA
jgi:hypothetical protein